MIRLRPLRPREQRNLRHWAMEFVVVVAGVLLALWAAEWAEKQRQSREDERIIGQIREEVRSNLVAVSLFEAQQSCWLGRLDAIKDALVASDQPFAIPPEGELTRRRRGVFDDTLRSWHKFLTRDHFQRGLDAGTIERLDEAEALRTIYVSFERFDEANLDVTRVIGELRALSVATELSQSDRMLFLRLLAQLDQDIGMLGVIGPAIYDATPASYKAASPEERADFQKHVEEMREYQGPCVDNVDVETGKVIE